MRPRIQNGLFRYFVWWRAGRPRSSHHARSRVVDFYLFIYFWLVLAHFCRDFMVRSCSFGKLPVLISTVLHERSNSWMPDHALCKEIAVLICSVYTTGGAEVFRGLHLKTYDFEIFGCPIYSKRASKEVLRGTASFFAKKNEVKRVVLS